VKFSPEEDLIDLPAQSTEHTIVMDPLSGLAVACNVLQVVEQGYKIISTTADIYRSSDGAPAEHVKLQSLAEKLQALNLDLESSIPRAFRGPESPETRLWQANHDCLQMSSNFINLLDTFKVKDSRSVLQSARKAFRIRLRKGQIGTEEKLLAMTKSNLTIALLVYMQ
jgi:hypothetical protein